MALAAARFIDRDMLRHYARLELARRDFWTFCQVLEPDFYKPNREFLRELCEDMQDFWESDDDVAIYNLPPRHGKSRTGSNLCKWLLGRDITNKIQVGSYNKNLSESFSKAVRGGIQELKGDADTIVYTDIFPWVRIKKGDGAVNIWSLEGGYNNYLATSPDATATGFGADLLMLDDLIKSDKEAYNANHLEGLWSWITNTMLQRLEGGIKIMFIATRWATADPSGRALEFFAEKGMKVRHFTRKAIQDDGSMLCPEILSKRDYMLKTANMNPDIASANYQQIPIDIKGRLYTSFKTYTELPKDKNGNLLFTGIYSYCDTADQGDDYLCNIIWGEYQKEAYILDVIYTKEPMEITEPMVAKALFDFKVARARIESNSGGRGFARNVRRILEEELDSYYTDVSWFHQSANKISRILSESTWVMNHIYFPVNWRDRWPDYHQAMTSYQREGKNEHDDAPDCTTGVAETMHLLGAA